VIIGNLALSFTVSGTQLLY